MTTQSGRDESDGFGRNRMSRRAILRRRKKNYKKIALLNYEAVYYDL